MRLQQVCRVAVLVLLAGGMAVPNNWAQGRVAGSTSEPASVAIDGTAPVCDPRYSYVRRAIELLQQWYPDLQIPRDIVRIVVDNKRLAKALGFPVQDATELDRGFMYTLTENGQFAGPTYLNVNSKVWHVLMANQRQDNQVEPVVCVLAASLKHEFVGHTMRGDVGEVVPIELEIAGLRECAQGGLINHPSVIGRLTWLERRLQGLSHGH